MESTSRSHQVLRRALGTVALGALAVGSLALTTVQRPSGEAPSWEFTRVAESARLRGGLSAVEPGGIAHIRFSLGGFRGRDVFAPGAPVSIDIGCASRTVLHSATRSAPARGALDYAAESDVYTYRWLTSPSWSGTCRRLTLQFADGSAHTALVWFGAPFGVSDGAPAGT